MIVFVPRILRPGCRYLGRGRARPAGAAVRGCCGAGAQAARRAQTAMRGGPWGQTAASGRGMPVLLDFVRLSRARRGGHGHCRGGPRLGNPPRPRHPGQARARGGASPVASRPPQDPLHPSCQVPAKRLLAAPAERDRAVLAGLSGGDHGAGSTRRGTLARPLQAATYQALISLLAVTGLRAGDPSGSPAPTWTWTPR